MYTICSKFFPRIEPFQKCFFQCGYIWNGIQDELKPIQCNVSQCQCEHIFKLIKGIHCTLSHISQKTAL